MSNRDKSAKFIELANKRVNRVIKDIRLLRNLSNIRNYDYTEDQVQKIFKALQSEIDGLKRTFIQTNSQDKEVFKL